MSNEPTNGEKHYHEAQPVPEEPRENMPPSRLLCQICGKAFKTHTQVDRHMQTDHGVIEGREAEGS